MGQQGCQSQLSGCSRLTRGLQRRWPWGVHQTTVFKYLNIKKIMYTCTDRKVSKTINIAVTYTMYSKQLYLSFRLAFRTLIDSSLVILFCFCANHNISRHFYLLDKLIRVFFLFSGKEKYSAIIFIIQYIGITTVP